MTVAKKIGAKQLKKKGPYKNESGQKKLTKQCRTKKMCLIKMTVAKKIGAKQLKKIAPYKNDWGQKNLNQTVYDKKKKSV